MNNNDSDAFFSGEQFQAFFKKSKQSLVMKANPPYFTVLAVSDDYLNITHKEREEVLNKNLFDVFPGNAADPTEKHSVYSSFMRVIEIKTADELPTFKYEIYVPETGKRETEYWSNLNEPVFDKDGNVAYLINNTINITETIVNRQAVEEGKEHKVALDREQILNAELAVINEELVTSQRDLQEVIRKLEESDNRFRGMINSSPVAMAYNSGKDLIFEEINEPMLRIIGRDRTIIGKPFFEVLHELLEQSIASTIRKVYETGEEKKLTETAMMIERDGQLHQAYFNITYSPVWEKGKVTGLMQSAVDVTEQVNARKNAIKAEELLRSTVEGAELATWLVDAKTGELKPSARFKAIFGLDADQNLNYETTLTRVLEAYQKPVDQEYRTAMQNKAPFSVEYPFRRFNDEQVRWVRSIGKPNFDEQGNFVSITGITEDITAKKRDDLRKDDFIGMVSHELKTPLTSMNGYIQIVARAASKREDNVTKELLTKAGIQVSKMTKLVNGFLNVSRLEAGKIHIDKQPFDMADLIKEMEAEAIATISSHNVVFQSVLPTWVIADKDKIGQVIENLISNAVKYSPGGTTIQVACVTVNNNAQVSIKDEGIGIQSEDIDKLFDRYYRVESPKLKSIAGFGIGLYLCAEIVEHHEGKIWVQSTVDQGSTFYFSLPIHKS